MAPGGTEGLVVWQRTGTKEGTGPDSSATAGLESSRIHII